MRFSYYHYADIKLRQQTESGLAKRAPSIKQMAMRYNSLVDDAKKKANATNFPQHLLPQPLDIMQLYNLDANPHMWMIDAIPTDIAQLPPYLTAMYDVGLHVSLCKIMWKKRFFDFEKNIAIWSSGLKSESKILRLQSCSVRVCIHDFSLCWHKNINTHLIFSYP